MDGITPQDWVKRLSKALDEKQERYKLLNDFATGNHPLPQSADPRWKTRADAFAKRSRTNYCGLATASVRERLDPVGFRSGADGDPEIDRVAWDWWQAAHLDADSGLVHDAALSLSDAYVIVGKVNGKLTITPEDPRSVIVELNPLDRRTPMAGLKKWVDVIENKVCAALYLPDSIHYFRRSRNVWEEFDATFTLRIGYADEVFVEANPVGVVPIVRFVNRPDLLGDGMAEFEDAIDVQQRINHLSLNMLQIAEAQAFRQRYVKGLPTEDEDGNPIEPPFEAIISSLWAVEDTDVEFGEFQQVDLNPILAALDAAEEAFITLTGLPPHYVAGDLVNASADALAAAEARLVAKVRSRQRQFGEAWEQVLRLAGKWEGVELPEDIEVVWADPERKTTAQLADAALKASQFGVPFRTRMADYGKTPQEIDRMEAERDADAKHEARRAATATAAIMGGPDDADGFPGAPGAARPAAQD